MIVITQMFNKTACAVCVLRKFGTGGMDVTIATPVQIEAHTALARAGEVCVLPNQGPPHRHARYPDVLLITPLHLTYERYPQRIFLVQTQR